MRCNTNRMRQFVAPRSILLIARTPFCEAGQVAAGGIRVDFLPAGHPAHAIAGCILKLPRLLVNLLRSFALLLAKLREFCAFAVMRLERACIKWLHLAIRRHVPHDLGRAESAFWRVRLVFRPYARMRDVQPIACGEKPFVRLPLGRPSCALFRFRCFRHDCSLPGLRALGPSREVERPTPCNYSPAIGSCLAEARYFAFQS